jgi:hypothetical protein
MLAREFPLFKADSEHTPLIRLHSECVRYALRMCSFDTNSILSVHERFLDSEWVLVESGCAQVILRAYDEFSRFCAIHSSVCSF